MANSSSAHKLSSKITAGRGPSDISLFGNLFNFSVIGFFCFIIVVPFFWLFTSSLKDMGQFCTVPIEWIPIPWHPDNYLVAMKAIPLMKYITNSIVLAIIQVIAGVFSSALIAYGFARFRFPGRELMFVVLISSMMLPWQATTIPVFLFFRNLGWLNSFLPLVIPTFFGAAWNIFLLRQFFISLPTSADEAATIDGCGPLSIWWRIIIPQSKPVLVVVSLFTFMWSWKDVWGPLIYLNDQNLYTLPLGLLMFESPSI